LTDTVFYVFNAEKRWGKKLSEMMGGLKDAVYKKYVSLKVHLILIFWFFQVKTAFIMINENQDNPDVSANSMGFVHQNIFRRPPKSLAFHLLMGSSTR